MSDRCARITLSLAVLPAVFGIWCLVVNVTDWSWRTASIAGTAFVIVLTINTWRRYVRWTVARSTSTAVLTLATLAQVAFWQPLWAISGCGLRDPLCTAQSLSSIGLWAGVGALLWWGALLLDRRRRADAAATTRRAIMSPNAVRLAIGIALMPFLVGLFWIVYFALDEFAPQSWPEEVYVCASYLLCAALAVVVWWLLWRRAVHWTHRRRRVTSALALVFLVSPGAVFAAGSSAAQTVFGDVWEAFCLLVPVFTFALWLAGTALAWRSPGLASLMEVSGDAAATEELARCPRCGYSLAGLREVRCPECGWTSTVDDIVGRSMDRVLALP